jgi:nucleoside-diphosphate-sugar epimerase
MPIDRLVVWGCGELGSRVARLWLRRGGTVVGVTQTDERHAVLEKLGIFPVIADAGLDLHDNDRLLLATPGAANQLLSLQALTRDLPPARSVLASTIGIYGGQQGDIDETSPIGSTPRSLAAAQLEAAFEAWTRGSGVTLRFGGLYQPGRGPFAAFQRSHTIPAGEPAKPLTLIHYDDAAQATLQALLHSSPSPRYLAFCSPSPTRRAFYTLARGALGLPRTDYGDPTEAPTRRFDTTLLQRDLLPNPQYPDWRAALTSE